MRASSLVIVLIVAKALAVADRDLPLSVWTLPAFVWHDVAVGVVFYLVDRGLGRPRILWLAYAGIAGLAAINVPITVAFSTPMTMTMVRAAGGPIADSIAYYATAPNLARMGVVCLVAALTPPALARLPRRVRTTGLVVASVLLAAGPLAGAQITTQGLHRNAVTAIAATIRPRVSGLAHEADWRAGLSEAVEESGLDLTDLRGRAAGRSVLLVALESTGARYLAAYGAPEDPTPNLTRLAREGLVFENAYVAYPESIKGLFAVLCSRDPAFDVTAETHAAAPCAPLPRSLARFGYRTALFHSGRFAYLGMDAVVSQQHFEVTQDASAIGGNVESSFGVDELATVTRMLTWIDGLGPGERFFITYLPVAGHHPYAAFTPGPFEGTSEFDAYRNALHEGDRALGALLDGLRARGRDDTIVVAFGDHGEAFGQHDGNFGHTFFLYEENVRVPLIVADLSERDGGRAVPAARAGQIASVIDIGPTLLELLGLPVEAQHEGLSLLEPGPRMALFFTDYALGWLGLRDGCWKYHFELDSRRSMLFDVCADAGETHDVVLDHAPRVDAYRARLEAWAAARRAAIAGQ